MVQVALPDLKHIWERETIFYEFDIRKCGLDSDAQQVRLRVCLRVWLTCAYAHARNRVAGGHARLDVALPVPFPPSPFPSPLPVDNTDGE